MNILLFPLAWLYGFFVAARNLAFDGGLLPQRSVGVPVISVGNMTVGGTGKTPLVEFLVALLLKRGRRVAVVSRGYGRRSTGVVIVARGSGGGVLVDAAAGGDEPVQIARKFPGATVVVGERRADAADVAVRCGADVIVLDDGFQHRSLRRNLDILVLDARKDIAREPMLPAGRRREWLAGLWRADLLAFSRADEGGAPTWSEGLMKEFAGRTCSYRSRITGFAAFDGSAKALVSGKAFVFSGIGDHASFVQGVKEAGLHVAGDKRFRDHHNYSSGDVEEVVRRAEAAGAATLITTEKDAVRLLAKEGAMERIGRGTSPVIALLEVEMREGLHDLERAVDRCLESLSDP